jgi:large subunit ribosomal protein L9
LKVLLTKDVPKIGRAGEIKEVADGHARNFLIPRGLAIVATEGKMRQAAAENTAAAKRESRRQAEGRALADRVKQATVTIRARVGEQHRLFGAVTAADIAAELSRQIGTEIDRRHVELAEPLKHLGTFTVPVRVAPKIMSEVTIVIDRA